MGRSHPPQHYYHPVIGPKAWTLLFVPNAGTPQASAHTRSSMVAPEEKPPQFCPFQGPHLTHEERLQKPTGFLKFPWSLVRPSPQPPSSLFLRHEEENAQRVVAPLGLESLPSLSQGRGSSKWVQKVTDTLAPKFSLERTTHFPRLLLELNPRLQTENRNADLQGRR